MFRRYHQIAENSPQTPSRRRSARTHITAPGYFLFQHALFQSARDDHGDRSHSSLAPRVKTIPMHLKHPTRAVMATLCEAMLLATIACRSVETDENGSTQVGESSQTETDPSSETSTQGSESESETGGPDPISYTEPGPHAVGNVAMELADPAGTRDLIVELWYPASGDATGAGQELVDFMLDDADAASLAALVDAASDACVRKQTSSADAPPLADIPGPLPTVVFSHCHGCARFSSFSLAERLASHGFLVAAVDHAGSTVFDALADMLPPLDIETLDLRRDDVVRVIDELLDPAAMNLPVELVGLADAERLGVFGHSFGSMTTGKVLQDDPRPRAGVGIAAPWENPVLPGITMAAISEPVMLIVAVEDNSITEFGNMAIRQNYLDANAPAWKLELADTGHFAFSDLAGLNEYFAAGCGPGVRQTDQTPFEYADPFVVRELTAGRITAFFALHLLGDDDALAQLEADDPLLDIQSK
jgi:dienelactone hydrolase